jgi:hypothetical protein
METVLDFFLIFLGRLMFSDNTYWNYPIEGEPVWYKLYRKFTDEPSLEEIQQ